ncbi:MAG TPA: hypothetical protein PK513_07460 [Alphaproteobacteria bacterium]|nr:hypothetical protein [Alphaproteobacteria bacterium]USO05756.1 MAG: hypothetical protein H6859_00695 [Rhodospirillales bacterium]HOO82321.1 hypothetical protein [Alphaproteobacteria bacterium]
MRFSEVENYNLSAITKYFSEKYDIDKDKADLISLELKRYLFLVAKNKRQYGMAGIVDEYWHTFILSTVQYHDFCDFLGEGYIHHHPDTDEESASETRDAYKLFFNDYEIEFGHSPLKGIWPSVNDGGRCKNSCKGSPSCKNRCKGTPSCKNNCKGGPHPSMQNDLKGVSA